MMQLQKELGYRVIGNREQNSIDINKVMKEKEEKEAERQKIRFEMKGKKWKSSRVLQSAATAKESVMSSEPR